MRAPRLLWRQFLHSPSQPLVLGLLVLLLAALVGAVPRYASNLDDTQLAHRLESLSALSGDVATAWSADMSSSRLRGYENPWTAFHDAAEEIRQSQAEPLVGILQPAQFLVTSSGSAVYEPPEETGYYAMTIHTFIDPELLDHVTITAGNPPRPPVDGGPAEVAVLETVAEKMRWEVGTELPVDGYVVSAVYQVDDPDDTRWQHITYGNSFAELLDPNRGMSMEAGLFLSPLSTGNRLEGVATPVRMQMWFPTKLENTAGVDVARLRTQLSGLLARSFPMASQAPDGSLASTQITLQSELGSALEEVSSQQRTANSLLLVLVVGPLTMLGVLIWLVIRLVVHRRSPALALAHARGASVEQLGSAAAFEGIGVGIPAAVLGALLGTAVVPGPILWWQAAPATLVAVLPALGLALGTRSIRAADTRADLGSAPTRGRLAAELLLCGLAAVSVWRLLVPSPVDTGGIDVLAALAPVLCALAVGTLALRIYPVPLRLASRALRAGRGLVGHLGSAVALRNPAGGLVPMFAVMLGAAVSIAAAVVLSTVDDGVAKGAAERNGSNVNVSGPVITDDMAASIAEIDGVEAVARLYDTRQRRRLAADPGETAVSVWLAESALTDVYATTRASDVPDIFGTTNLVTGGDASGVGAVTLAGFGPTEAVMHWETLPGTPASGSWVLLDVDAWRQVVGDPGFSRLVLVSTSPAANTGEIAQQVHAVVGGGLVEVIDDHLARAHGQPVVSALGSILLVAAGLTVLLMAAAVVLAQSMGSEGRSRTAGVLKVLGAPRATVRALAAWELLPMVISAILIGTGLGIGIAALLITALDFRSLTGGLRSPTLHVDIPLLLLVLGAVAVTTAAAVTASAATAGRTDLSRLTREGP